MAIYKLIYDQQSDPPAKEVIGDFLNREAALAALNARQGARSDGRKFRFYEDDVEVTGWTLISATGETDQLTAT